MTLTVLGSNSSGNGYVLKSSTGECLALEAGLPYTILLKAVGYVRSSIVAVLTSHVHQDHFKFAKEYIECGLPLYSHMESAEFGASPLPEKKWHTFGSFQVMPFSVHHDVPNYGYVIKHPEFGSLLFATDCNIIPTAFRGIKHFLIEANYSDAQLLLSDTDKTQKRRISEAHMSLESCVEYLHACKASATAQTVTLIHLSSRHSNSDAFQRRIEQEFGVPCYIARKGLTITLDDIL